MTINSYNLPVNLLTRKPPKNRNAGLIGIIILPTPQRGGAGGFSVEP